jgi:hypothetical protein
MALAQVPRGSARTDCVIVQRLGLHNDELGRYVKEHGDWDGMQFANAPQEKTRLSFLRAFFRN